MTNLNKLAVFEGAGYRPHEGQLLIHSAPQRMKVAACGRRFGKSVIGGHELLPEAMLTYPQRFELKKEGRRREFWIVGPEYSDSEKEFRVAYDKMAALDMPFDRPGTYNNPDSGDMAISMFKGAFIVRAMSAKYPATLVGEGLSGVILAEAAKLKESVWVKYLRPTLADYLGWSLMTSTPEGKNWFYRAWQRGQDEEDTAWASWRMPSWMNPIVFPEGRYDMEILDMAGDMSDAKFNQEIGADFSDFVGRVFVDWDEETHVQSLQYDPRYPVYACCDYGWTNPFVWLVVQIDAWDNLSVLYEYRTTRKDINEIATDLAAHPLTQHVKVLYPDPAEPGDTAVLEKKLKLTANTNTGGELKHRLEAIRLALKVMPEHGLDKYKRPKLLVDRSCVGLIREMDEYRYPESKEEERTRSESEKPMDKDDHGPEALGRFFKGHYGGPLDRPTGKAKVRRGLA